MRSILMHALASASLLSTGLAIPKHAWTSAPSAPLPPSQDPFYTAPQNFESASPGAVLRVRPAPGNLTSVIANTSAAYNILYRTTDSNYKPSWAVTTLYVPSAPLGGSSSRHNGSALLSYQWAYDSDNVDDSPSYTFYTSATPDLPTALGQGWFVSVADYEGPQAAFGVGVQAGHATLDSVRAVLSSGLGLAASAKYAMWGYSGGGLATEWAAELQAQYAPELSFAGAAMGGLPANATSVFNIVNKGPFAFLTVDGPLGLTSQDPAATAYLLSQLKTSGPFNRTGFLASKKLSFDATLAAYAFQDIFQYFEQGSAVLQAPPMQSLINRQGLMGYHGIPQMPIYAYKAIDDQVCPTPDMDALIDRFCGVGVNILYQRNSIGGHTDESTNGAPMALEWLSSVFDGTYASKFSTAGCTIENVAVNISDTGL